MKIKEGFILRKVAGSDMVIPIGNNIAYFNGIFTLNDSAAFLWKVLKEGTEFTCLIDALRREYDLSVERATEDTEQFLNQLREADLLEDYIYKGGWPWKSD